ncbi:IclR family transcriptional regulator [Rhodococcus sp. NPDC058514]|uniref:IclR family transcriptional regulator n=1 Tax=unclassified Rhodococcus (in: high G+C Gram-positive bacteria) TaxID=192944 RepID=UPI00364ECA0A
MAEAGLAAGKADGGVRSIARAVDVLQLFDLDHPRRTLREIVALTGLPKTTVVRVLATLGALGLIVDQRDSTYGPGAGFLRWVDLARSLWDVDADARRIMARLVDACGETVNVYIRQDLSRISIAQVEGTATVRSVVRVGAPYTLETGAAAKVLLGGAPESVLRQLSERPGRDPDTLRREVTAVSEAGYAVSHGERELGASAVAAPILSPDGRVLAALSVGGPTSRFTADRVRRYVDAVTESATEIGSIGLGRVEAFL